MPDVLQGVSPVYLLIAVFAVLTFLKFIRATARTMLWSVVICGLVYLAAFVGRAAGAW